MDKQEFDESVAIFEKMAKIGASDSATQTNHGGGLCVTSWSRNHCLVTTFDIHFALHVEQLFLELALFFSYLDRLMKSCRSSLPYSQVGSAAAASSLPMTLSAFPKSLFRSKPNPLARSLRSV